MHCAAFIVRIRTAQVASLGQAVRGVMPEAHSSHKGSVQSQHRARRQPSSGGKHSMCAAARTRTSSWRPRTHLRRPITMNRLATAWSWPRSRRAPRGTRGRPAAAVVAKLRPGVHDVLMCSIHTVQRVCVWVCCGVAAFMWVCCGVAAFMRDQFDMVLGGQGPGFAAVAAGAVAEGDVRHVVDEERLPRLPVRVLYGVPRPRGPQALLLEPSDVATCVAV